MAPYISALGEFPVTGTPAAKLRAAIRFAVLAPSARNTQPWTFHIERDSVLLYADRRRGLPVVDPDGRELTMSCGAALFNLRITLRHFGYDTLIDLLPGPADLIAAVTLGPPHEPTEEEDALFDAIPRRHTIRRPFRDRAVPGDLVTALERCAWQEGACLTPVTAPETRTAIADLTAAAVRLQMTSRAFRRELADGLQIKHKPTKEGMPVGVLGVGELKSLAAPLVLPVFDVGADLANQCREVALSGPMVALLSTPGDSDRDWICAGEALQHVLLRAEMEGLGAEFLNYALEVPAIRPAVATAVHRTDYPQLLLRMGYGRPEKLTGRRQVEEVLV